MHLSGVNKHKFNMNTENTVNSVFKSELANMSQNDKESFNKAVSVSWAS